MLTERRIQIVKEIIIVQGINNGIVCLQSCERLDMKIDTGARELPTPVERINESSEVGDQKVQIGPAIRNTLLQ
jgi:hypothetical protein